MRVLVFSNVVGLVTELFGQVEFGSDLFSIFFEVVQLVAHYIILCIFPVKALKSRKSLAAVFLCTFLKNG